MSKDTYCSGKNAHLIAFNISQKYELGYILKAILQFSSTSLTNVEIESAHCDCEKIYAWIRSSSQRCVESVKSLLLINRSN